MEVIGVIVRGRIPGLYEWLGPCPLGHGLNLLYDVAVFANYAILERSINNEYLELFLYISHTNKTHLCTLLYSRGDSKLISNQD